MWPFNKSPEFRKIRAKIIKLKSGAYYFGNHFTYHQPLRLTYVLKLLMVILNAFLSVQHKNTPISERCYKENTKYTGHDVYSSMNTVDQEECVMRCFQDAQCKACTYYSNGVCRKIGTIPGPGQTEQSPGLTVVSVSCLRTFISQIVNFLRFLLFSP